jgi:hypothetical protein
MNNYIICTLIVLSGIVAGVSMNLIANRNKGKKNDSGDCSA